MVDVAALPLVLCGPMLRRVETRQVSVFVALKEERWLELDLHDAGAAPTGAGDPFAGHGRFAQPRQRTVALGAHLHVAVVTLRIPAAVPPLRAGVRYAYDVRLFTQDTGGTPTALAGTGLLAGDVPLGYATGHLPSFAIPPDELASLSVLHGSCRKPHGGGDLGEVPDATRATSHDMLAAVDDLLAVGDTYRNPLTRPHLLLLTGDQIYADDVAPPLLRAAHDLGNALLGWTEEFRDTDTDVAAFTGAVQSVANVVAGIVQQAGTLTAAELRFALDQLVAELDAAAREITFSENPLADLALRTLVRMQLEVFAKQARDLITEATGAVTATLTDAVEGFATQIQTWIAEHEAVFANLTSTAEWGAIATVESVTDHDTLAEIRGGVAELLARAPGTGAQGLDELAALLQRKREGRALRELLEELADKLAEVDPSAVAPLVDAAVVAIGTELLTRTETRTPFTASRISPPQRPAELRQHAELTSNAMTAHLMFLGEFYAMYLLAWSDACWPRSDGAIALPAARDAMPNYTLTGELSPRGLDELAASIGRSFAADLPKVRRVLANVPTLMMFDDHEVTDDWNLHADWVAAVNGSAMGPQLLRNAMASYAVFQDWGNQPDDYLPGRPGHAILDALTAPGGTAVPPMADHDGTAPAAMDTLFGNGPDVATRLGEVLSGGPATAPIGIDPREAYAFVEPAGRKRWEWVYEPHPDIPLVRFLTLDTRTHRGFPTHLWAVRFGLGVDGADEERGHVAAPALLHPAELDRQLVDRLENDRLNVVVSPAPAFGLPLVEDFAQRLEALRSGPEVADFEAWSANPAAWGALLLALREVPVVLLSGDVHYAYSNLLTFTAGPGYMLLQLCSSSLCNEDGFTRLIGAIGREARLTEFLSLDDWTPERLRQLRDGFAAAVKDIGEAVTDAVSDVGAFQTWLRETAPTVPFVDADRPLDAFITWYLALKDTVFFELNLPTLDGLVSIGRDAATFALGDLLGAGPVGEFGRGPATMHFLADERTPDERIARAAELNGTAAASIELVPDHALKLRQAAEVVGFGNVGRIAFDVPAGGPPPSADQVRHELVWRLHRADAIPDAVLGSTVHGSTSPPRGREWDAFRHELVAQAEAQYRRWHPVGAPEIRESDAAGLAILEEYRTAMAPEDALLHARSKFHPVLLDDGTVRHWSAWFISYVVKRAQAGPAFAYSARHIDYIRAAKANRLADNANPFRLLDKDEADAVVQVGDILVGWRNVAFTYDSIDPDELDDQAAHCDIVVEVTDGQVFVIGGNVAGEAGGDVGVTANRKTRPVTAAGRFTGSKAVGLIRAQERTP